VDEIPFDFNRKRLSVVMRHADENLVITKGEAETVFAICQTVDGRRAEWEATLKKLGADGYRVYRPSGRRAPNFLKHRF
jgi:Mg2+-importing ATPase